ncbi:MAG: ImmA/IrrE family metallo-endopeptidase, partial [Lachnospiraceae bacterium]|nr:ImmA/IrrE family metallo-endopeptidase [Lachnospiraceae bacterium]
MEARDIIRLARGIRKNWKTNDPFAIAERLGIRVLIREVNLKGFKAQTVQMEGYPTIISINGAYAPISRKVLCAHELGHAILHEGQRVINHFAVTEKNIHSDE